MLLEDRALSESAKHIHSSDLRAGYLNNALQWPSDEWRNNLKSKGLSQESILVPTSTTFEPKHAQQLLALLRESAPSFLSDVDDEQALVSVRIRHETLFRGRDEVLKGFNSPRSRSRPTGCRLPGLTSEAIYSGNLGALSGSAWLCRMLCAFLPI